MQMRKMHLITHRTNFTQHTRQLIRHRRRRRKTLLRIRISRPQQQPIERQIAAKHRLVSRSRQTVLIPPVNRR